MYMEVTRFITIDGKLFVSEDDARTHAQDLLGQELDALVRLAIPGLTRSENYKAAMSLLSESNREELKTLVGTINKMLLFDDNQ